MLLRESVALITGASRGLGLEVARAYARRGARLIITARDRAALAVAARTLGTEADPDAVVAIPADVADPDQGAALVRVGIERFGRIDVLVNNASTLGPSPLPTLDALSTDALLDILRTNVAAPQALIRAVLPAMKTRRSGVIINVTSDAGVEAYATWGGYGMSKAALEHLSRVLAAELEGSGIRVYVVDPGDMHTRMHEEAEPGVDLSHLPPPSVSAPAFVTLVEDETVAFGRFHAQRMAGAAGRPLR
jgi:NAD(P)-dependent dehydrogenase (short-subunit alcohol dehydrogenase family)